jgi:hypothetical protein
MFFVAWKKEFSRHILIKKSHVPACPASLRQTGISKFNYTAQTHIHTFVGVHHFEHLLQKA